MEQIDYYKNLFESKDKLDVFELNIDFIKDLIDTKTQIEKISHLPLVIVHKTDPTRQKISEAAKVVTKLKQVYANQIVVLNKLLGNNAADPDSGDSIESFKRKHRIADE
jgi:hypothetical protein